MRLRCGERQLAALELYVFDPAHDGDDERHVPGHTDGACLVIEEREQAFRGLTDAANAADDDGDRELRDALTALASRVLRA